MQSRLIYFPSFYIHFKWSPYTHLCNSLFILIGYHYLWNCPEVKRFWNEVLKSISQITLNPVPYCPKLCILMLYPKDCALSSKEKKIHLSVCFIICLLYVCVLWSVNSKLNTYMLIKNKIKKPVVFYKVQYWDRIYFCFIWYL